MGQSSSQLDQPSQLPPDVDSSLLTMQRPPTAGTTGSRALARDLERSIMDSSQDIERQPPKKRRKKKRQQADGESAQPEAQGDITMTAAAIPQAHNAEATTTGEEQPKKSNPKKWKHGDSPLEVARRDLQKWLKRKEMQEAVLENRAKWVQMPNKKWGIKFYKPGEAPEKELTQPEAAHLKIIKMEMEKCRQALGVAEQEIKKERKEENEAALASVPPAQEQVNGQTTADEDAVKKSKKRKRKEAREEEAAGSESGERREQKLEPEEQAIEVAPKSRRAAKRARRHSREEAAADAEVRGEAAPADKLSKKEKKKKKKKEKEERKEAQKEWEDVSGDERPMREFARKAALQGLKQNADNINAWLANQEDPAAPAEDEQAPEGEQTRKRKRVSQYEKDDEEDYNPSNDHPSIGITSTESSAPTTTSGPFTAEERAIADRIYDEVLREHNLSKGQLNVMIKSWRTAGAFKAELEHALPSRSKDQIRKFAQRRYHGFERGPWTPEQDEALRDAHAKCPGLWTEISKHVDRLADDCKDRWVKHLQFGGDKATGPWSQEEESKLLAAVDECIDLIKKEYEHDKAIANDRGRLESMISWNTVSSKVAGGRSAKRCREKFEKLKARQRKEDAIIVIEDDSNAAPTSDASKDARKEKEAQKLLESFELGDYYDVFVEVHSAVKDHNVQYHDEKNVLWSIVAQKNPASRFNMTWAGGALRRLAVETALAEWPVNSKKIKRKMEQAQTIPAKALQLAKLVERRSGNATDDLPRTFKPDLIGKTAAELHEIKIANKRPRPVKPTKKGLSKDYISESDADEEEDVLQKSPPTVKKRRNSEEESTQEEEIPESSEDELASPERDIRREPSREVEANDDNDGEEDDSTRDDATQEVPETQFEEEPQPKPRRRPRLPKLEDDIPVSSLNSKIGMESLQSTPSLSPEAFLQRCNAAGKRQHEEYMGSKQKSSGRR